MRTVRPARDGEQDTVIYPGFLQDIEEKPAAAISMEDGLPPVSSTGHIIQRAGKFEAKESDHASPYSLEKGRGKT